MGPHLTGKEMSKYEDVLSLDVERYLDTRVCACDLKGTEDTATGTRGRGMKGTEDLRPVWRLPLDVRCKKRGRSKAHPSIPAWLPRMEKELQPLESVNPGHPLWDGLLKYAAEDAIVALECGELLQSLGGAGPSVNWFPGAMPVPGQEHL